MNKLLVPDSPRLLACSSSVIGTHPLCLFFLILPTLLLDPLRRDMSFWPTRDPTHFFFPSHISPPWHSRLPEHKTLLSRHIGFLQLHTLDSCFYVEVSFATTGHKLVVYDVSFKGGVIWCRDSRATYLNRART